MLPFFLCFDAQAVWRSRADSSTELIRRQVSGVGIARLMVHIHTFVAEQPVVFVIIISGIPAPECLLSAEGQV
jgi:hypothetical protein